MPSKSGWRFGWMEYRWLRRVFLIVFLPLWIVLGIIKGVTEAIREDWWWSWKQ